MTQPDPQPSTPASVSPAAPLDATYWAQLAASTLSVSEMPHEAVNLNVAGRRLFGPLQGFGPLWKKTFRVRLTGRPNLAPDEIVRVWKTEFPRFWPTGQRFYASPRGIVPGEVALLNLRAGGLPLDTGMLVLYADDESFTLMTPQGHMYASWITFSAYDDGNGMIAQVQMLLRSGDPIFAVIMHFGGFRFENRVWAHTLVQLARRFDSSGKVQMEEVCLDPRVQWAYVSNIWYNAGMRTAFYTVMTPIRGLLRGVARPRSGATAVNKTAVNKTAASKTAASKMPARKGASDA